jgi:hypothetical protein
LRSGSIGAKSVRRAAASSGELGCLGRNLILELDKRATFNAVRLTTGSRYNTDSEDGGDSEENGEMSLAVEAWQ